MQCRVRWIVAFLMFVATAIVLTADRADAQIVGQRCGGWFGLPCLGNNQYCDPVAGQCSTHNVPGTCVQVTGICTRIFRPVCGCNGRTYSNDCVRQNARVGKRHDGPCRPLSRRT